MRRFAIAALALGVLGAASTAKADDTILFVGNLGVSYGFSDPYDDLYTVGGQVGGGVYYSFTPRLAIGGRIDGIGLLEGDEERGSYGAASLMAAARFRPLVEPRTRATGLYVEGAIGPAIAEDDGRLAFAAGIGWNFEVGALGIGPMVRYTQVIERDRQELQGEDARIVTAGVEIVFGDAREAPMPAYGEPAAKGEPGFEEGRMVIDEQVFFDYDEATLRPEGRQVLDYVAEQWREQADGWKRLRVQGHADERGPASYNVDLSRRRAEAVARYLAAQGVPAERIDVEAYGESQPLIEDATSARDYQMNRRVQFEIVRE